MQTISFARFQFVTVIGGRRSEFTKQDYHFADFPNSRIPHFYDGAATIWHSGGSRKRDSDRSPIRGSIIYYCIYNRLD
ncbi:hypothetical protein EMIT0210MI2_13744 [Priestia megaterium]